MVAAAYPGAARLWCDGPGELTFSWHFFLFWGAGKRGRAVSAVLKHNSISVIFFSVMPAVLLPK